MALTDWPRMVSVKPVFSLGRHCSFSRHPGIQPLKTPDFLSHCSPSKIISLITLAQSVASQSGHPHSCQPHSQVTLASIAQTTVQPYAVHEVPSCTVTSTVLIEAQPRWHLSATILKCHPQSHIIADTVEPSYPSEKLISRHGRLHGTTW